MNVVMVDNFLPANSYTLELAKELKSTLNLTLFCKEDAGDIEKFVQCKKELYSSGKNKLFAGLAYFNGINKLKKYILKDSDIVHVQSLKKASIEIPFYMNIQRAGVPVIHTVHNVVPHEAKKSDWNLYGKLYKTSNHLIVHNERTKRQLIDDFNINEQNISIIPHGIYGEMIPNRKEVKDKCIFLMFGLVRTYKGIDTLLEAISLLKPEVKKKCRFIIAGAQDHKQNSVDYIKMAKELNIDDMVEFVLRRINDDELYELFTSVDACVFPYREIYGSGALLMAYTYQKPVIVSDVPTFIEETDNGKTGLLFEKENSKSLADTIENFVKLDRKEISEFCNYIEMLVKNKYNWKKSAQKTYEIYEKIYKLNQ